MNKKYYIVTYELYQNDQLVRVGEEEVWHNNKSQAAEQVKSHVSKQFPELTYKTKEIIG